MRFGNQTAGVNFAGLADGLVGLYQLNVAVPTGGSSDVPFTGSAGGTASAQTLFTRVE